ncbi:DUF3817 domain-containing protein [Vaginella massiliensis]|uniref:DUF3817 domain-containing protein n=1 Tax=Vaginella massiliensis TaxID=1816680 RepID=UPI000838628B|nr:DUF3817 domain-containing protein [Vaginella massiliensis]
MKILEDHARLKKWFKIACVWEAISCALLFLVAMPIKYQFGNVWLMPFAGTFHGFWFSAYVILAFLVRKLYKWDDETFIFNLLFAFIPLATLLIHKDLDKTDAE